MEDSEREWAPRSWTARVLAPLALILAIALVYLVATGQIGGVVDEGAVEKREEPTTTAEGECNPPADEALRVGFYILKPDEPGLSAVADRTCIPVEELTTLNPELNPQTIQVGQCVNLRENGCEAAG